MTVTHRKASTTEDVPVVVPVTEPGVLFECDSCNSDVTHTIRIKCAAKGCEEVDLCPSCFCEGKEFGGHKAWHEYRVLERHSYPIFTEDWGADEELLLIEGLINNGLGNWAAAADHIGTRTKEEAEQHYRAVYQNSPTWPLPNMDLSFNIDPDTFHERKKRRIGEMRTTSLQLATAPSTSKPPLTSAPTNHEVQGFMPGRLEFETEIENEAEELIKDLEFGLVETYGGDEQPPPVPPPSSGLNADASGAEIGTDEKGEKLANGQVSTDDNGDGGDNSGSGGETPLVPDPLESDGSLALKVALLDIYLEKLDRRAEAKSFVFDRGMLEFKKLQALDKKRPKEDRELITKHKPFSKLQTAEDFEEFVNDVMHENALRLRIAELQEYRKQGIRTLTEAEKYNREKIARLSRPPLALRDYAPPPRVNGMANTTRLSVPPGQDAIMADGTVSSTGVRPDGPRPRKQPAPLNLANAASLHLLTPAEQTLCSQLRILPKPFLVIKETLVSEFARRGGKLRRREARDLCKIDVNKTSRIWDFLEAAGFLKVPMKSGVVSSGGGEGDGSAAVT